MVVLFTLVSLKHYICKIDLCVGILRWSLWDGHFEVVTLIWSLWDGHSEVLTLRCSLHWQTVALRLSISRLTFLWPLYHLSIRATERQIFLLHLIAWQSPGLEPQIFSTNSPITSLHHLLGLANYLAQEIFSGAIYTHSLCPKSQLDKLSFRKNNLTVNWYLLICNSITLWYCCCHAKHA